MVMQVGSSTSRAEKQNGRYMKGMKEYNKINNMKEILFNLALIDTIGFCKANSIDCSGSHLVKYPRKFIYALVSDETGRAIVTVSFSKSETPKHTVTGKYSLCAIT
jgi:hypothetical protein